jgi:hypothetical protein
MNSCHIILLLFALSSRIPSCTSLGWTWMGGEKTIDSEGYYGEKGVSYPSNIPRARYFAISFFDKNSNKLWLFGGLANTTGNKLSLH